MPSQFNVASELTQQLLQLMSPRGQTELSNILTQLSLAELIHRSQQDKKITVKIITHFADRIAFIAALSTEKNNLAYCLELFHQYMQRARGENLMDKETESQLH
ncbi:hypothetical protein DAPPUDRAFT_247654 [Daphnia pulex]|uniref:Uncharacterized protein n=1 Tax=Daphnia pulex TaxID=6669 RepID=E9GSW4_DAPPU|nr:hypothetical protein DAPPUDRAFT_247654 [Daphnia pulex]|eukprot:EFX77501.1 hypothetical protein DAPPUDRAFT_247654 [Daphnia pulex]